MSQTIFVFVGVPFTWKFFAMAKLAHLLRWSGYRTEIISNVLANDGKELKAAGLDNYHSKTTKLDYSCPFVLYDDFLGNPESRDLLYRDLNEKGATPVFIEWSIPDKNQPPISLLFPQPEQEGLTKAFGIAVEKAALHKSRSLSSHEEAKNRLMITLPGGNSRNVTKTGMDTPLLARVANFLSHLQPSTRPITFLSRKDVEEKPVEQMLAPLANKEIAIFSSTERWASDAFNQAKGMVKHPRQTDVRDASCYLATCLDDEMPELQLVGLTADEISAKYFNNMEFVAKQKEYKLNTDLMTYDQINRILLTVHDEEKFAVRKPNKLTRRDYWPLITDLTERGTVHRLIICGEHSRALLSEYFQ